MNYFETLVQTLLEVEGYWTRAAYKVNLDGTEKKATGKHSIPRPELDVLALDFLNNEVLVMEVKSYLDSPGVKLAELSKRHEKATGRYKLFTCDRYREIVFARLAADLHCCGMADASTKIRLGLAAGKVYQGQTDEIRALSDKRGWVFWSPADIKTKVTALAESRYENNAAIMTAKVLLR
jgi:hypothetical protein